MGDRRTAVVDRTVGGAEGHSEAVGNVAHGTNVTMNVVNGEAVDDGGSEGTRRAQVSTVRTDKGATPAQNRMSERRTEQSVSYGNVGNRQNSSGASASASANVEGMSDGTPEGGLQRDGRVRGMGVKATKEKRNYEKGKETEEREMKKMRVALDRTNDILERLRERRRMSGATEDLFLAVSVMPSGSARREEYTSRLLAMVEQNAAEKYNDRAVLEGPGERILRGGSAGAEVDGGLEEVDLTGAGGNDSMDGERQTGGDGIAVRYGDSERVHDLDK